MPSSCFLGSYNFPSFKSKINKLHLISLSSYPFTFFSLFHWWDFVYRSPWPFLNITHYKKRRKNASQLSVSIPSYSRVMCFLTIFHSSGFLFSLDRPTSSGKAESDCHLCDDGKYCAGTNNTAPTADCSAGYYCKRGNRLATPNGNSTTGGPCYKGHYCLQKTSSPTPCTIGKQQIVHDKTYCYIYEAQLVERSFPPSHFDSLP